MDKAKLSKSQRYYIRGFIERADRKNQTSEAYLADLIYIYDKAWIEIELFLRENYLNLLEEYAMVSPIFESSSPSQVRGLLKYREIQSQLVAYVSQLLNEQSSFVVPLLREKASEGFLSGVYHYKVEQSALEEPYIFNQNVVDIIMQRKWFGGNYYSRSVANSQLLQEALDDILVEGALKGFPLEFMTMQLEKRYKELGTGRAKTLVYSEVGFVQEQANFFAMKDVGIERYIYLATLEANTCNICGDLDMTIHKLEDAVVGLNYPLMHGNCRCNAVGYYEGEPPRMRWMRDPETGKGKLIRGIPYNQWFNQYVLTV